MELLDASATDAWGLRVCSPPPLMSASEHDALASFLVSVDQLELQEEEQPTARKRKRRTAPVATGTDNGVATDRPRMQKTKKISTHQRRRDEIEQLTQALQELQKRYEQIQSDKILLVRKTRDANTASKDAAEREIVQTTATNMHLRRSVQRAQAKAITLCRLLAQMSSPSPMTRLRGPSPVDTTSDNDIFRMLERRLGSKALDIHRRLLEGEFQLPEVTCESNDACVNPNGNVVDFAMVRILPFDIDLINDITWRCYNEIDYAPGMIQLLAEKCGDVMTVKQVFLIERKSEPDILLVLRAVFTRFKRKEDYIVTWEGVIDGSLQIPGGGDEAFCTQTRESGWGIARPLEHEDDSPTVMQTFIQVTPNTHKSSIFESSESLVNQTLPTYTWVLDKRYQELENRLLDGAVRGLAS